MKAIILTSKGLRHRYFIRQVTRHFDVPFALAEEKKNYYVQQQQDSPLVAQHFRDIAEAEKTWFGGEAGQAAAPIHPVEDLNADACVAQALAEKPDVICLYGTTILKAPWLEAFPDKIVNLHLGLSPFYRGSATLFWPFVHRELEHLGTTIHLAVAKVDAGNILARVDTDLRPGEDYYAITTRLIRDSIDRTPEVVAGYLEGRNLPRPQEPIQGRVCRKADFNEDALRKMLDYAGNGLSAAEIQNIERRKTCRYSP
ncbi:MAG TPA: formyltransferase family protein [Rhizomicrobium sp.]|nr:formyltransferase family protein [Rhizomicrobium sp.]